MRVFFLLTLLLASGALAQPGWPSFCFVLAGNNARSRPLERPVQVVQHCRERIPYVGISASYLGPAQQHILESGPLFRDSAERWMVYYPVEAVAECHVLVISGTDTMRIDLPEDPTQLIDRARRRGMRDTPEVIRFKKGRYTIEELMTGAWPEAAATTLARRLIAEDDAAYKKELAELENYYRDQPPVVPAPAPYMPPPPMTQEEWEAEVATRPGLKKLVVDSVRSDTVWVKVTGRVMLNGGCASGMPLFSMEMLTDTGWVERIPFELIQMDCGMPWADWEDHTVMIPPLRWWVSAHSPAATKELKSGTYRLLFMGANMRKMWTEAFELHGAR